METKTRIIDVKVENGDLIVTYEDYLTRKKDNKEIRVVKTLKLSPRKIKRIDYENYLYRKDKEKTKEM